VVCGLAGGYQSFGGTYCLPEDEGDMFLWNDCNHLQDNKHHNPKDNYQQGVNFCVMHSVPKWKQEKIVKNLNFFGTYVWFVVLIYNYVFFWKYKFDFKKSCNRGLK
jgi:hypothetical protein